MADYNHLDTIRVLEITATGEENPYPEMLHDYFRVLARGLVRGRPRPETAEEWRARREALSTSLRRALGPFPERTPLNARTTGAVEREGCRIEKIVFESRPRCYVTANLYLPTTGTPPFPAVLNVHGHHPRGKNQFAVQARSRGLARRGFACLTVDAVGFNERAFMKHHSAHYLILAGLSLQGLEVWDNIRALDLLAERSDVDPERLGCTGSSGGGNQTMYLAAIDQRVKAAVPVASACTIEELLFRGVGCACECLPGLLRFADIPDVLSLIAPRALLIIAGTKDRTFPVAGAREAFERAQEVYRLLDAGENLGYAEVYAPHAYNRRMREQMYAWMERHLAGHQRHTPETEPVPAEPEETDVLDSFPEGKPPADALTVPAIFAERCRERPLPLAPDSAAEWTTRARRLKEALREQVLGCSREPEPAGEVEGTRQVGSLTLERIVIRPERGILVPAVLLRPPGEVRAVLVFVHPGGKDRALADEELRRLPSRGVAVCSLDYRAAGETLPTGPHAEFLLSRNALVLGSPLAGGRAADIHAALGYLRGRPDLGERPLFLYARDQAALPALLAAALSGLADGVALEEPLATFRSDEGEGFEHPSPLLLPGVLEVADIPEIAALLAPRRLAVANPYLPPRRPAPEPDETFSFTRQVYALLDAPGACRMYRGSLSEVRREILDWWFGEGDQR